MCTESVNKSFKCVLGLRELLSKVVFKRFIQAATWSTSTFTSPRMRGDDVGFDIVVDADGGVFSVGDGADGVGYVVGDVSADEDLADGGALALIDFKFAPVLFQLVCDVLWQEGEISGLADG